VSKTILVRGARQLLTLRGPPGPRRGADLRNLGIIQDGSVLIVDGIIREVGTARRLENLAASRDAEEINAAGCVVLPGFVDSHTHLIGGPARLLDYEMNLAGATQQEIDNAGGGVPAIFKAMQDVSIHTLEAQGRHGAEDCFRHGTTTIEAKSGYGINETGEIKILRAQSKLNASFGNVISTFMASRYMPGRYENHPGAYVDWLCNYMLPLVWKRKLATFADIACEEDAFSVSEVRQYLLAARQIGFGLKMHAGQYLNIGSMRLAAELGIVSVDHAIYIDADDAAVLANSAVIATLLPGPVFHLAATRYAPARMLIDAGVGVALATGYNPQTSPSHSMQTILSLACRHMHMTPAEAISAATINGAHALSISTRVGSIEFGKDADLVIVNVPDYRELPYHFGGNLVDTTMQRGRVIYRTSGVKWPSN
jgi:imidazolonepropionase